MQVQVKKLENATVELHIQVPADAVSGYYSKELETLRKTAKIDGFRQGSAPVQMVKSKYADVLNKNLLESVVKDTYFKAVEEQNLRPIEYPSFDFDAIKEGEAFDYKAIVELYPTVTLKDYKKIKVKEKQVKIGDEDVTSEVDRMRDERAQLEDKPEGEPVAKGDQVVVKYRLMLDSKSAADIQDNELSEITVIAGRSEKKYEFDAHVNGMKVGDSKMIEVSYPSDYSAESLAGKKSKYYIKIAKIQKRVIPAADDAFAASFGDGSVSTMTALRDKIRESIEKYATDKTKADAKAEILDSIVSAGSFDIPLSLVKKEKEQIIENMKRRVNMQETNLPLLASFFGTDEKGFIEKIDAEAEKSIRTTLTLSEIAVRENLEVTDELYKSRVGEMAQQYGYGAEELAKVLEENGGKRRIMSEMIYDVAMDYIYDNADITKEKPVAFTKFVGNEK